MATGRTTQRWLRFYADGYDLSGYLRKVEALKCEFDAPPEAALSDEVKNALADQVSLGVGALNGFFDNTATSGLHVVASGAGVKRVVLAVFGIRAAPAAGDPAYAGEFTQLGYAAQEENSRIVVNIPFGDANAVAAAIGYVNPWGVLLHAKGAETAVNSSAGIDDHGAATALGGFMCYQLFSSNGTVTLKVQDAAVNADGSFADLSGATSGSINASVTPAAGIVALGTTATVRRYLRWQLVFGTATTATFALSFARAKY